MIELSGTYEFGAPRELVWETFLDPAVLARIMPGCERLERVGDNEYEGLMKIRVGPVQGTFQGTVQLSALQPPQSYHMLVNGRGPAGIVHGEGDVRLESSGDGTVMHYEGEAQISGRIATVGQRLMESSAQAIARQSLDNLDRQVQARQQPATIPDIPAGEAAARPVPGTAPPAPSQTEFALGVARDVVTDLIPDSRQRWLLGGGAVALVLAALLNWFANLVARRVVRQLRQEGR